MKRISLIAILILSTLVIATVKKDAPKKIANDNEAKKICPTVCGKDNWEVGKYTPDKCECKK